MTIIKASLNVKFTTRTALNILHILLFTFMGSLIAHKWNHTLGYSLTCVSLSITAWSLWVSKYAPADNNVVVPYLHFFTEHSWPVFLCRHLLWAVPLFYVTDGNIYTSVFIFAMFAHLIMLRQAEYYESNKNILFADLLKHYHDDNEHVHDCSKLPFVTILDWLSHVDRRQIFNMSVLNDSIVTTYRQVIRDAQHADAYKIVDDHLHISLGGKIYLTYKNGHYHWYGSDNEYHIMLQVLCLEIIEHQIKTNVYNAIIEPRNTFQILQQMEALNMYPDLTAEQWFDIMIHRHGNPHYEDVIADEMSLFL